MITPSFRWWAARSGISVMISSSVGQISGISVVWNMLVKSLSVLLFGLSGWWSYQPRIFHSWYPFLMFEIFLWYSLILLFRIFCSFSAIYFVSSIFLRFGILSVFVISFLYFSIFLSFVRFLGCSTVFPQMWSLYFLQEISTFSLVGVDPILARNLFSYLFCSLFPAVILKLRTS